ncbi:alpha/beta hydrolase [Ruminococcaceae bacterium OttesenSCG-928-I18]|nr:alpha/beta hydrolase [Ruminococcaceae bacterium OttesenSCG-928-I18]
MQEKEFFIEGIPALLFGPGSDTVFVAVHGNRASKNDTSIRLLAEAAVAKGCQVLSFDLPAHGARAEESTPCKAPFCVRDLQTVLRHAKPRWPRLRLFGCSLGAYFGLLAYPNEPFEQALFLSPVVNMQALLEGMMREAGITPDRLRREGEIPTSGETLSWDYYCYVRQHPVATWHTPTEILWGDGDFLTSRQTIEGFCGQFGAHLTVLAGGEHFFHTPRQLAAYKAWLAECLF